MSIIDDVLAGYTISTARRRADAREAAVQEAARRRAIVQQAFPDDPVAQIAAEANWEEFGKNLAENYGVDVAAGGSTVMARGQRFVAPRVDQFSDRAGVTTVGPDGRPTTQYTEPRGPTFEELSQDRQRQRFSVAPDSVVMDAGPTGGPGAPQQTGQGLGFADYGELQSFLSDKLPGVRFTSGRRDQATQDRLVAQGVTRARNSAHVNGLGQDIVPDAPQSEWGRIAADLEATGRFRRVLVERGGPNQGTGPHIHLEPIVGNAGAPSQEGGARMIASNPRPDGGRDAPSGYRWTSSGNLEFVPGGPADPNTSRAGQRPIPAGPMSHYRDLRQGAQKIDKALAAIEAYPQGLGLANFMPDWVRQRTDAQGVEVRAAVADIGSLIIHDRSGAAVTAAEAPRLKPFIPLPTDAPDVAAAKLRRLKDLLESEAAAMESEYSPEQGFRGFAPQPQAAPRQAPARQTPRPAPGPARRRPEPPRQQTPRRPANVPANAKWDAANRQWVVN